RPRPWPPAGTPGKPYARLTPGKPYARLPAAVSWQTPALSFLDSADLPLAAQCFRGPASVSHSPPGAAVLPVQQLPPSEARTRRLQNFPVISHVLSYRFSFIH